MLTGIVPKMAIRFTSYEWYKQMLADKEGNVNSKSTFAGTWKITGSPWVDWTIGAHDRTVFNARRELES